MDRDTVIITVYCLVVEHYRAHAALDPIRHGGVAPEVSDEEVITMEICDEYLKHQADQDLFDYFHAPYRHFFPKLTERTLFVQQAANLWQVKAALQQRLTPLSGQAADPVQAIDTLPVPVCTYTWGGRRDKGFPLEAAYGHCAAKKLDYYGFKLGLRITRCGMITPCSLLAARPHDINHLDALVEGFTGLVPADKGFIEAFRQDLLQTRHDITIITPVRARMAPPPHSKGVGEIEDGRQVRPHTPALRDPTMRESGAVDRPEALRVFPLPETTP